MSPPVRRVLPIALGTMIVPLDTAVNIAFPAITARFGLALPEIQWVVIGYVLTYGSLMLGIGRLGDIFGHALVFRLGLAWSSLAFLACAWAPDYGWLLVCRVLQGIGAALVISCGPALITAPFPEAMRARMLGLYGLAFAAGSAIGPSLGGVLVARWGWEAVFWFRAPVALAALLLLALVAGRAGAPAVPAAATARREPFDAAGAALLALAIGTLLLAVNQARRLAEGEFLLPLALGAAALASAAGFVARSRRSERPVVDLALFRLPGFALVNAANALVNLAGFAVLLFVPYWLTRVAGLPTGTAGLVLAASPFGGMLAAPVSGWLVTRLGPRRIAWSGAALAGIGLLAIGAGCGPGTGVRVLALALLAQGFGLGLFQVAYTDIVTGTMRRSDRGVAGSLSMVTRTLGIVSAASLLTLLFDALQGAARASGAAEEAAFLQAFRLTLLAAGAVPFLVLAAAALSRGSGPRCGAPRTG
jgi:MFS family permease